MNRIRLLTFVAALGIVGGISAAAASVYAAHSSRYHAHHAARCSGRHTRLPKGRRVRPDRQELHRHQGFTSTSTPAHWCATG